MKLDEIMTVDVKKDAWRPDVGGPWLEDKSDLIELGEKGRVIFYWNFPSPVMAFMGDEQVGYMLMSQVGRSPSTFQVKSTAINPKYQGFNLAVEMYVMFLKNDRHHCIVAGDSQSEGGQEIWKRLADNPELRVYVWDRETGHYETLDGDELDSDEHGVYDDGPVSITTLGQFPESPTKLLMVVAK